MKKKAFEIILISEKFLMMPIVIIITIMVAIIIIASLNSNYLDETFIRSNVNRLKVMRSHHQP